MRSLRLGQPLSHEPPFVFVTLFEHGGELLVLFALRMIDDRLLEFREHPVERRARDVQRLEFGDYLIRLLLFLKSRLDDFIAGSFPAHRPEHLLLGGFMRDEQGGELVEGFLSRSPLDCSTRSKRS